MDRQPGAATLALEVAVEDERWGDETALQARAEDIAPHIAAHRDARCSGTAAATILLASDAMVRDLNARFRSKDAPTNVLSFPAGGGVQPGETTRYLGDIILAYETVAREAEAEGISLDHHMAHLIVHGVLHLTGHDHLVDSDAELMESTETAILAALGIADPYRAID